MRKNLAKHAAKKLPLAKRVLALCFALIFVCSCLLPAFANGTGAELDTPDTEVVEEVSAEPETLDDDFVVDEEPAALEDDTPVSEEEPVALDDSYGISTQPIMDGGFGMDADTATQDEISQPIGGIETPISGGSTPIVADDSSTIPEGPSNITTDKDGNIVYEYDVSDVDFGDDFTISRPDGDHALDQVDAAYSIPTNIYHFWLKKMSSYDLADIARDAKAADMTVEQYLAMYGTDKGCFHIMTAADGANLKDYQFTDPTPNDDPEGNSRTFAGWYYTDELGDEHKFVFDEFLYISEGTTVEVYAKWKAEPKPVTTTATLNELDTTVTVDGLAGVKNVQITPLSEDDENDFADSFAGKVDAENKLIDLYSFDLTPLDKDEKTVQPDSGKKATVTIKGLDVTADDTVKVFHKTEYDTEDLTSTAKVDADGTLTFKTESFSPFAVVVERTVEDAGDESDADSDFATYAIEVTNKVVYVGETITLTGSEARGSKPQHQWAMSTYDGQIEVVSGGQSQTMTVRGVKAGTVAVTHYYTKKNGTWREESITITVAEKNTSNNATVFILLTPGSHRDSNDTDQWGYGIVGAKVDISNATGWVDDNKNLKINLDTYIESWPNNGDVVTLQDGKKAWDMPLTTIGYDYADDSGNQNSITILDQIWSQWSAEIKKQADGTTLEGLKKGDIKHVYVVPYKISRWNGTSGSGSTQIKDIHIDSEIRIVCDGIFTARFFVEDAGTAEDTQISSRYYVKGSTIPENNGNERPDSFPNEKIKDGITYVFDGWYNEEGEKVESWNWTPTQDELEDGTVDFFAHYVPKTQDITITKQVTGLLGDHEKSFNFTLDFGTTNLSKVTCTYGNVKKQPIADVLTIENGKYTFQLKDGESLILHNVPSGATFTVTEDTYEHYETHYKVFVTDEGESTADGTPGQRAPVAVSDKAQTVKFINHNTVDPDMGVLLDTLPYILILAVVVGGGALLFLRKRKNDDDDE